MQARHGMHIMHTLSSALYLQSLRTCASRPSSASPQTTRPLPLYATEPGCSGLCLPSHHAVRAMLTHPVRAGHAGVDLVFAGHLHAYERTHPTFRNATHVRGPTYINIGDGGNREGPTDAWLPGRTPADSHPAWSAFRSPHFGHGKLALLNCSHAHWTWHRVQDGTRVVADEAWLTTHAAQQRACTQRSVA